MCCVVLCFAVLCWTILCCAVLLFAVSCSIVWCGTSLLWWLVFQVHPPHTYMPHTYPYIFYLHSSDRPAVSLWCTHVNHRHSLTVGDSLSYLKQWEAAGYHCLVRKEGSVQVEVLEGESDSVTATDTDTDTRDRVADIEARDRGLAVITVSARWTLVPSEDVAMANHGIACSIRYTFSSSGQIDFTFSTVVPTHLPPAPRIGVRAALNRQLDRVEWLGLGPHEAYDDRKAMVYLDHFTSTVEDLHTEYVFPQECGRRLDPRWVTFRDVSGMGFEVRPCRELPATATASCIGGGGGEASPYQCCGELPVGGINTDSNQVWGWSASRYSTEQLADCAHNHELQPDSNGQVHIHLDRVMMGLAGYDSWSPNVPKEFIVPVGEEVTGQMTWSPVLPPSTHADAPF